ncbi:hypothetical protein LX36DRAFT_196487 [Colletotrichum falcatum]|nr:hypothetical protein LX36DRAFT_196487 [Colletotrichum falcatum]
MGGGLRIIYLCLRRSTFLLSPISEPGRATGGPSERIPMGPIREHDDAVRCDAMRCDAMRATDGTRGKKKKIEIKREREREREDEMNAALLCEPLPVPPPSPVGVGSHDAMYDAGEHTVSPEAVWRIWTLGVPGGEEVSLSLSLSLSLLLRAAQMCLLLSLASKGTAGCLVIPVCAWRRVRTRGGQPA